MVLANEIHEIWGPDDGPLRGALTLLILEHEATSPGLTVSNVGGWHSRPDFLTWDHTAVRELHQRIRAAAVSCGAAGHRAQAWANVLRRGGYHAAHQHGEADLSGVYYVDPGDGAGGEVRFARGDESCTITPRAGLMLIFPGPLLHSVDAYAGTRPRISVAFNLLR